MGQIKVEGIGKKDMIIDGSVVRIVQNKTLLIPESQKSIPISKVSSVQVKKPGMMTNGYIQLSISGQSSPNTLGGGVFDAAKDENSVVFRHNDDYAAALRAKEYIENTGKSSGAGVGSAADEIRKFKALLDEGIISQDDFEKKKRELLDS